MKNISSIPKASPDRPQFIFQGTCPFCTCWAARLSRWLDFPGDFVRYKEHIHYPLTGVDRDHFETGVLYWDPHSGTSQGGEAVMNLLEQDGEMSWLVRFYRRHFWFKKLVDSTYHWVSRHRSKLIKPTFCGSYVDKVES